MPPRNATAGEVIAITNAEDPNIEKTPLSSDDGDSGADSKPESFGEGIGAAPERNLAFEKITDGFDYLQAANRDPLRLWRTKAPKGAGEVICVLCQDVDEVVLIHQRAQRFTIYARA